MNSCACLSLRFKLTELIGMKMNFKSFWKSTNRLFGWLWKYHVISLHQRRRRKSWKKVCSESIPFGLSKRKVEGTNGWPFMNSSWLFHASFSARRHKWSSCCLARQTRTLRFCALKNQGYLTRTYLQKSWNVYSVCCCCCFPRLFWPPRAFLWGCLYLCKLSEIRLTF